MKYETFILSLPKIADYMVTMVEDFVKSMEWDRGKRYLLFDIWISYSEFCRERGVMPCTTKRFSMELVSMGREKIRTSAGIAFVMVSEGL